MNRQDIVHRFMETAAKLAVNIRRVASTEELNTAINEILPNEHSVYCPNVTTIERAVSIPSGQRTGDFTKASVCVQEAHCAIAETGSLIWNSRTGKPTQAGLLVPHHLVIVSSANIYDSLEDFFGAMGDHPPTNITFETGPSRTADIELTLTIGVHGPGKLTVLVY